MLEVLYTMSKSPSSLLPYRRAIPQILIYQFFSAGILSIVMLLYRQLTGWILWNIDRPAFTSGDLPYLLKTWQGWMLIILGFLALVIYTVFDINATILLSDKVLKGEKFHVPSLLRDAVASLNCFRGLRGVLVILYVSLAAPLAGSVFGITLTSNFTIPNFIMSVIKGNALYYGLYIVGIIILSLCGLIYVFTFDFAILGKQKMKQAMGSSRIVMKENWKNFLIQYIVFILKWLIPLILCITILYIAPCILMQMIPLKSDTHHAGIIFFSTVTALGLAFYVILFDYFIQMKLTQLYYAYTNRQVLYRLPAKKSHHGLRILLTLLIIFIGIVSYAASLDFDTYFPKKVLTKTIAHRAGGILANENTVLALNAAVRAKANGAEVDVQRTKDGHYIINHDSTFKRVCGDPRTSGEMTLAEIKKLKVHNLVNPLQPDTEVATMEEMLDAAKGKIQLYIELKGKSADFAMAEDVIKMAKERDMMNEVTLISLDYDLIDTIESEYPDVRTGYLCYFSFGSIQNLNCDAVLMEEEVATSANIDRIHKAGKEAGVWTVNTTTSMSNFLSSDVDWVITDEVSMASTIRRLIETDSDESRVLTTIIRLING